MAWMNPTLLFGLGFVVVPVIIHLLFRPKPKRHIFPALRLILTRRQQNVRRLQLRHFWLLFLRMLVLGVLVVALSRPSLPPANFGFSIWEWLGLLSSIAVPVGVYFFLINRWKSANTWTKTEFLTRRAILRSAAIGLGVILLLLGVGLPYGWRIRGEMAVPPPSAADKLPVAAVFLFDTSASLQYKFEGKNRLEAAKEIALAHLGRLPAESKLAIAETGASTPPVFYADLSTARSRVEALKPQPFALPLEERLRQALKAQEDDRQRIVGDSTAANAEKKVVPDRYVREIYLFTDLLKSAWKGDTSGPLKDELKRLAEIGLYVIDVGIEEPVNVGLSRLRLPRQSLPEGRPVILEASVLAVGQKSPTVQVDLFVTNKEGKLEKRASQSVATSANAESRVKFQLDGLAGSFHQGELRLTAGDPLAADDVLQWSVNLHQPPKILVVAESFVEAREWMDAIAPPELLAAKRVAYVPKFEPSSRLSGLDFKPYDVVCLINVANPADDDWKKLSAYVDQGGGLAIFTGQVSSAAGAGRKGINPVAYNSVVAQNVMPAELKASLKFNASAIWDPRGSNHPMLQRMETIGAFPELSALEFRRYWSVTPNEKSAVLVRYNQDGNPPALLERVIGSGRVMLCTTSVDSVQWNDLLSSWFCVVFADQMMQHLSRTTAGVFNYEVGDDARVNLDVGKGSRSFLIRQPDGKQTPIDLPKDSNLLRVPNLATPGQYQIVPREQATAIASGFSVNLTPAECDLTRLDTADLDRLLGEKRYGVSRDPAGLKRIVSAGRLGQEVFGLILLALMTFFLMEHFVANWFYTGESVDELPQRPGLSGLRTSSPPTDSPQTTESAGRSSGNSGAGTRKSPPASSAPLASRT